MILKENPKIILVNIHRMGQDICIWLRLLTFSSLTSLNCFLSFIKKCFLLFLFSHCFISKAKECTLCTLSHESLRDKTPTL